MKISMTFLEIENLVKEKTGLKNISIESVNMYNAGVLFTGEESDEHDYDKDHVLRIKIIKAGGK